MTKEELKEHLLQEQLRNISNALLNMFTRTKAFYFQVTTTLTVAEDGRYEVSTPDNFPVFTPKGQGFLEDGGNYFRGELKLRNLEEENPSDMAKDLIENTFKI
ncbi:hypothetical protein [Flammeovirga sp. SJP92]|uniref:hypothetical protein n=1 Tax=Flammeovirga sp. SJP92 TaxID=1775430 RepID=UPI000786FA46|nr:hypothetical protein [Flammeovirga sp. SJP92]KXX71030.1 hypothetical protein AVL50_10535 [Flammeovirga sp. SJP92]